MGSFLIWLEVKNNVSSICFWTFAIYGQCLTFVLGYALVVALTGSGSTFLFFLWMVRAESYLSPILRLAKINTANQHPTARNTLKYTQNSNSSMDSFVLFFCTDLQTVDKGGWTFFRERQKAHKNWWSYQRNWAVALSLSLKSHTHTHTVSRSCCMRGSVCVCVCVCVLAAVPQSCRAVWKPFYVFAVPPVWGVCMQMCEVTWHWKTLSFTAYLWKTT